jgi:exodeoxyribonuclease VII small subunit
MLLASQGIRKNVSETDFSQLSFEQALIALEEVVQQLESGSVPLDQSITLYERGEKLRKLCQARLDDAQARIEKIVTDANGAPSSTVPFDTDG